MRLCAVTDQYHVRVTVNGSMHAGEPHLYFRGRCDAFGRDHVVRVPLEYFMQCVQGAGAYTRRDNGMMPRLHDLQSRTDSAQYPSAGVRVFGKYDFVVVADAALDELLDAVRVWLAVVKSSAMR